MVRRKDKYLSMTIDSKTNMPTHIPRRCTSKIDFRCYPEVKEMVMAKAEENNTSQTKIILEALDIYWKVINSKKMNTNYNHLRDRDQLV